MFGLFRGAGNLAEQEGVLHLGLNDVSPYERDGKTLFRIYNANKPTSKPQLFVG